MSAYQAFLDWREARLKEAEEKGRKEAEEQARQAERKLLEKLLQQQGKTKEEIQHFLQLLDDLGNLGKKSKD